MAKVAKKKSEDPVEDLVYEYDPEAEVRARLTGRDGSVSVGNCVILSRKPFEGQPLYWVSPRDMKLDIQYVKESDILGAAMM